MTRSDLVMVEREVLADALAFLESEMHWSQPAPDMGEEPSDQFTYDAIPVAMALRAALQSVEGGVQVAAKQESCPESAPRTETTVRDWRKSVFTYEHDDAAGHLYYFAPQVTAPGPFLEQRHVQAIVDIASDGTFAGVELIDNMPPLIRSGGADTESDGGTSPSNETRGGAGDDCSVGKRGAWPNHDGQVCAQRLNVENQNPDVTGGESAAPNSAQLTKTPSADHDDGNLRDKLDIAISALEFARDGYERIDIKHIDYRVGVYTTACDALDTIALPSIPNHQPHAVSQGWRTDLENAPGGVRFLIAGRYPNGIWYVEESYRHYAGHFNGRKIDPPTHWMPLPEPPDAGNLTGGDRG